MKETIIIAFMNHKGGVGKTTTSINVADAMSRRALQVLLVDLDAQANLTYSLRGDERFARSVFNAIVEGGELPIIKHKQHLSLIPSTADVAGIDGLLTGLPNNTQRVRDMLQKVRGRYDYIILDCPPGLNIITYNAIVAADHIVVTMEPYLLSFIGLAGIIEIVDSLRSNGEAHAKVDGVVFTKCKGRRVQDAIMRKVQREYPRIAFDTFIRENIKIAECTIYNQTIYDYDKRCNGAKDYTALTSEILKRYNVKL